MQHKQESFPVLGMSCASCAASAASTLKAVDGVSDAEVNFANQTATVVYDNQPVAPTILQQALQSIGYDLVISKTDTEAQVEEAEEKEYIRVKTRTIWSGIITLPIVALGMFLDHLPYSRWVSMVLTAITLFYFGRNFYLQAYKQARHGRANMDTLVALSTGIAFIFSVFNTFYPEFWLEKGLEAHVYYETAAVIVVFISLGKLLELRARSKTTTALKKLIGLQSRSVRVLRDGEERMIDADEVRTGDLIVVKPGEKLPVDGRLHDGESYVDESMISGEPIAVAKAEGDQVFAGTINQKGAFTFVAEKVGNETLLSQIINMVRKAQASQAPVQKLVDKVAGVFVPTVIVLSVFTFIIWIVFGDELAFSHALLTSITVLVIACPCALGLATPTAIMVGVGKGAEHNILIKDAESLELAYQADVVVLDKTGTITEGKPKVTDFTWTTEESDWLKNILYTIEIQSEHPLASAIVQKLSDEGSEKLEITSFESVTGEGVRAKYGSQEFMVGNRRMITAHHITFTDEQEQIISSLQDEAKTVVFFADDTNLLAIVAIADIIKPTSATAVEALKNLGLQVHMLTGDNMGTAEAVSKAVGIEKYKAETLPQDKADYIEELKSMGHKVVMVGDGINDSQALAQADVSVAMGKGSDIAMDVAKITLITSDLNLLPKALALSKKTVNGIRQNLFWAFIYNLIGIPIAAGVLYPINGFLLDPMIAGAAMALSSVSVVMNSLRLKSIKL